MSKETNVLIVKEFNMPSTDIMGEAMAEELDGMTVSFDVVKIPSGGGIMFELPGDNPEEPETVKEIVGVIVDHHPVNAYWQDKYSGQNNPPDCSSLDGKFGQGIPGGDCSRCPLNQFGSAEDGKGKACKNIRRVYILREGDLFPLLLRVPPTSLKNFTDYVAKRVLQKGYRSYGVITKVTLKKAVSSGGITYSQAVFTLNGILSKEQTTKMAKYSEEIKATTRKISVMADEYISGEESGDDFFEK